MDSNHFDILILGQGLAGTALAWSLKWSGRRVLVIDRDTPGTSSKVAAGLITPITGQRLVKAWKWNELWPAAREFYRRVEHDTGTACFRQTTMVRLLANTDEHELFARRLASGDFGESLRQPPDPPLDPAAFSSPSGALEMLPAGQLDVSAYLRASRLDFSQDQSYLAMELDLPGDLEVLPDGIRIPRLGVTTSQLVFCQGLDATTNPWFSAVRFKPAKGEVLTLRIPNLTEQRVVHRGVWLAPSGDGDFRAGSTYEWQELNNLPTASARAEIEARLREFLNLPYDVVDHQAAVRPIHLNQYPVLGLHPEFPQLGYFNGLGSKGALQAPYFARHFTEVLAGAVPVDPEVDLNRRTDLRGCRP